MEDLSLELVSSIIDFTSDLEPEATRHVKPRQAYLTLVCKQWRDLVEHRTFGTINIKSTEIETFADVYGGQLGIRRRAYLHDLVLDLSSCVEAPSQTDSGTRRASRRQRSLGRQRNNEEFTGALRDLFTTLNSWSDGALRERTLSLTLSSPSRTSPFGKIRLLTPDTIPQVQRITRLACPDTIIRLGSLPLIAFRLPNLQEFNWDSFESDEPLNAVRRLRDRYGMWWKACTVDI